ncbi:MAG: hypothetical protein K6B72_13860 [Lachnospiraceae bacterium]|nr:hypothetical protein [Lachnospiraceae bacterium]
MKMKIVLVIIAIVLLLLIIWFSIPYSPLKAGFEKDTERLLTENRLYADDEVFTAADFEDFPAAVRKYIENSGYIGKRKMNFVRIEYRDVGFCQGRNGPKLTIDYTQYDYAAKPDRMALIESSMFGIPFQGYDYYHDGRGGMKGVIAKLFTLFDQTGEEMDRACLVTFLAESMFVPTALLQDYIVFEEISEYRVKAAITAYGQTVSGIFTFNEDYEMVSFSTNDRAVVGTDGTVEYVPWSAVCSNYEIGADGINRPTGFQAIWNYEDEDFVYFDGIISSITYG